MISADWNDCILLVEDNRDTILIYKKLFSDIGFDVKTAETVDEGLDILAATKIDIALLDVELGEETGLDVLRSIRAKSGDNYIFVVMITAKKLAPEDQIEGFELGADGYILRPVTNEELVARINAFMRHKRTIDSLKKSETQFRRIIDRNPDALLVVNGEGRIKFANPAAGRLFMRSFNELLELTLGFPVISGEHAEINILQSEGPAIGEMRSIDISWNDRDCILTSIRDITERRKMESDLRERHERFRLLFRYSFTAMAILNLDGEFREINSIAFRILGRNAGALKKTTIFAIIHPSDRDRYSSQYSRMSQGQFDGFTMDLKIICPDQKVIWGIVTTTIVRDEDGIGMYTTCQIIDITARKNAEDQAIEMAEQRRWYAEQLRGLAQHLEEVREEQNAYIAREIHDELGQLLTATEMGLTMLIRDLQKSPLEESRHQVIESIKHTRGALEQALIEMKRLVHHLRPTILENLGLPDAVEWLLSEMKRLTGIQYHLEIVPVKMNPENEVALVIYRIIQECLTNIRKHAQASSVHVALRKSDDGTLAVRISDNGIGFDTSLKHKGFGLLGMRERVLNRSGTFHIESAPEKGTTIEFTIASRDESVEIESRVV